MRDYKKMSFDDFISELNIELEKFKKYWHEHQASEGKEMYPDQLNEGDWFEQYIAFLTMTKEIE